MSISPEDAEELVQLRSMLERAHQVVGRAGHVDRTAAVVDLDAVVEHVMYMAAVSQNLVKTKEPSHEALIQLACEAAGPPKPPHLVEIRRLRRCRNSAQHEGIPTDPDQLRRFLPAVDEFVRTLVSRIYEVELTEVVLAEAIATEDLSQDMRQVGEHLNAGRYPDAMRLLEQMQQTATQRWMAQRAFGFPQSEPRGAHRRREDHQMAPHIGEGTRCRRFGQYLRILFC